MFKKRIFHKALLILILSSFSLFILGCAATETYAPVVNAWKDPCAMKSRYCVQKDDTLYSIAWAFDLDYRDLAMANHLSPPYHLSPGQTLTMEVGHHYSDSSSDVGAETNQDAIPYAVSNLASQEDKPYQEIKPKKSITKSVVASKANYAATETTKPVIVLTPPLDSKKKPLSTTSEIDLPEIELRSVQISQPVKNLSEKIRKSNQNNTSVKTVALNSAKIIGQVSSGQWQWPARGTVVREFSLQPEGNKGIDISGRLGDPVRAVAPGKVVYSGSGLRGYGNLVIIKHSDNYLSAYAHNKKLLVKEGDVVKAGGEIAKMGQNNRGEVLLHFEIRRNGKPVNPLQYCKF